MLIQGLVKSYYHNSNHDKLWTFIFFVFHKDKNLVKMMLRLPNMSACSLPSKNCINVQDSTKGYKMELGNWITSDGLLLSCLYNELKHWRTDPAGQSFRESMQHHGSLLFYFLVIFLIGSQQVIKNNRDEHQKCVPSWSWRIAKKKKKNLSIQLLSSFLYFFLQEKEKERKGVYNKKEWVKSKFNR